MSSHPRAAGGRLRTAVTTLTGLGLVTTAGCGLGEPRSVDPAGVDGLEIPTASPDPADFVRAIDNPYLPLAPGNVWRYEMTEGGGEVTGTIEVQVIEETRDVAGVTATVVHDVVNDASGSVIEDTYDWYAQDTRGNVWSFGEDTAAYGDGAPSTEGLWEAGVDGAQAGLVMAARPEGLVLEEGETETVTLIGSDLR